jgi:uncharacterized membrane protein YdbT with pleckstrin-like domain
MGWLQSKILSVMMVPPEPHPPEGSVGSVRIFRAGKNYYRFLLLLWGLANFGVGVLMTVVFVFLDLAAHGRRSPQWAPGVVHLIGAAGVIIFAGILLWTFLQQQLSYDLRWYIVTDRSLRVRQGIWSTHELTTTFANIQEIRVTSGPIQKFLGLADLEVHSAGGGGGGPHGGGEGHVARFGGLDNANEIRDYVVDCLRRYRDSGLGEATKHAEAENQRALAAAEAVLAETRALRAALGKS